MKSTNIPEVKLGIVAVSRDCFPIQLSEKRRAAIVAACHVDPAKGFRVLVALPQGTNTAKPEIKADGGDDAQLWACNKWLLAHVESSEAAAGAYVGLEGVNIDIADDL